MKNLPIQWKVRVKNKESVVLRPVTKKKRILKLMVPLLRMRVKIKIQIQKVSLLAMSQRIMKKVLSRKILPMNLVKIQVENMMVSVEEPLGVKWLKVASQ